MRQSFLAIIGILLFIHSKLVLREQRAAVHLSMTNLKFKTQIADCKITRTKLGFAWYNLVEFVKL